jgi:hypothetical protein
MNRYSESNFDDFLAEKGILEEVAGKAYKCLPEAVNLALLSEAALAGDWERPEEDEAWSHLAQLPSL